MYDSHAYHDGDKGIRGIRKCGVGGVTTCRRIFMPVVSLIILMVEDFVDGVVVLVRGDLVEPFSSKIRHLWEDDVLLQ